MEWSYDLSHIRSFIIADYIEDVEMNVRDTKLQVFKTHILHSLLVYRLNHDTIIPQSLSSSVMLNVNLNFNL